MVSTINKRRVYLPFANKAVYRKVFDLRRVCILSSHYPGIEVTMGYCYFNTVPTDVYQCNVHGQSFWMPMYHLTEWEFEGEMWQYLERSERVVPV